MRRLEGRPLCKGTSGARTLDVVGRPGLSYAREVMAQPIPGPTQATMNGLKFKQNAREGVKTGRVGVEGVPVGAIQPICVALVYAKQHSWPPLLQPLV